MRSLRLLGLGLASALSFSSAAEDVYFYAGMGDVSFSPDWAEDNRFFSDPSLTLGLGERLSDNVYLEGFFRYSESTDDDDTIKVDFYTFGASLLYNSDNIASMPLKLFGRTSIIGVRTETRVSDTVEDFDTSDDTGLQFTVGGGVHWDIKDSYWARAEYIYGYADSGLGKYGDYDGLQVSIGMRF